LGVDEDTHVLIPSRPGYLRTPVSVGMTPAASAEAIMALLDKLEIEKTTVLGWSGGGPTAIALAEKYPGRIDGLVLLSARVTGDDKYRFESADDTRKGFDPASVSVSDSFWGPDLAAYGKIVGLSLLPDFVISGFFADNVESIDLTIERLEQLISTVNPPSMRAIGMHNDYWQFASLPIAPKLNISIPTLIIHSPIDASVNFSHAQYAAKAIAKSELYVVENESHLSTMNAQTVGRFHTFLERLRK
jgi:pimeloyl-ACP methyl ester carboxylesterase